MQTFHYNSVLLITNYLDNTSTKHLVRVPNNSADAEFLVCPRSAYVVHIWHGD